MIVRLLVGALLGLFVFAVFISLVLSDRHARGTPQRSGAALTRRQALYQRTLRWRR